MEFWYARELMELLEYSQWRNFEKIIEKAKVSCDNNGICVSDHFADVSKMVEIGSKARRPVDDYMLTRYACYLIRKLERRVKREDKQLAEKAGKLHE